MTSLPPWMDHGACKGMDQAIFFPHRPSGKHTLTIAARLRAIDEQAKAVCHQCPVQAECLNWALTQPEVSGTWGGLTDTERRNIQGRTVQRLPGPPTCGTNAGFMRHRRDHHEPCDLCRAAHQAYMRDYMRNWKKATA